MQNMVLNQVSVSITRILKIKKLLSMAFGNWLTYMAETKTANQNNSRFLLTQRDRDFVLILQKRIPSKFTFLIVVASREYLTSTVNFHFLRNVIQSEYIY